MCAIADAPVKSGIYRAIEASVELFEGRMIAKASPEMRGVGIMLPPVSLLRRLKLDAMVPEAVWCPFCFRMERYHPIFVRYGNVACRMENRGHQRVSWTIAGNMVVQCDDGHLTWVKSDGTTWSEFKGSPPR